MRNLGAPGLTRNGVAREPMRLPGFDAVKERYGLSSDYALAEKLGSRNPGRI